MKLTEIPRWYHARPGYWFRPKLFGWGATPVTWQGWLATLAMIAAALVVTHFATAEHQPVLLALLVPLVLGFILLCHAKTDGEWRWRWGGDA